MAKRGGKDIHVVKNPDGGWDAKRGSRVLSTSRTRRTRSRKARHGLGRTVST
jgi:hypothetical protein